MFSKHPRARKTESFYFLRSFFRNIERRRRGMTRRRLRFDRIVINIRRCVIIIIIIVSASSSKSLLIITSDPWRLSRRQQNGGTPTRSAKAAGSS